MMEKSSEVILSDEEKALILGKGKLTKEAAEGNGVPARFEGWYSHEELKDIANGSD